MAHDIARTLTGYQTGTVQCGILGVSVCQCWTFRNTDCLFRVNRSGTVIAK